MNSLKPKARHEQVLADADKAKIVQHLSEGQEQDVTRIAVSLARQCDLLVHFQRLWKLRVSGLDARLAEEEYMRHIFVNRRALHKELSKTAQ